MKKSFILSTILVGSIFLTGCAFNTVSNTTIKKNSTKSITPPPPVIEKEETKKKIKKIVKKTGVPQYGPNIYKSASGPSCNGGQCIKSQYDITQTKCLDFPITYRAKREVIQKDTVLFEE
jgi:hypothetical protein